MPKTLPATPVKKKGNPIVRALFLIILFLIVGRYLNFGWDFPYLDILWYLHRPMTFEETMKLINPLGPKGYTYPNPSETAYNRTIDCRMVYEMPEYPRTDPLCLNMFRTSVDEIHESLAAGSHDRIVLYGERSIFDAPAKVEGEDQYIENLYNTVKFMDLIALPKFLDAYGLKDTSYITVTRPYPYFYYRISSLDESDKMCDRKNDPEQVQGCARGFFVSVIPIAAIGPQFSNARPILRRTDNKRFSYLTHYPSDCYTNDVFAHETAHMLNIAGQMEYRGSVMGSWLTEQIAGLFAIYGDDLACGAGTVTNQKNKKGQDVVKELIDFNAPFAPAALSHSYPEDSMCKKALLSAWYQYLAKGDYRANFRNFFIEQRRTTPTLTDDGAFAKFLIQLDPDVRSLLQEKGCPMN